MITTREKHPGRCVAANGIDINYVEAGQGEPLLLLDNAMVSTNPVWTSMPVAYAGRPASQPGGAAHASGPGMASAWLARAA